MLPVVLVLSGTLAVTRVPWAPSASEAQVLTASSKRDMSETSMAPQDVLRRQLVAEVQQRNPGAALTDLQVAMAKRPSLAGYCSAIARALGRAAVTKYSRGGNAAAVRRAQAWSRPVCDTSFAAGVADMR
ncbi:Small membrane protein [Streptantibioticus cattleyicolor NRRL 8057 = DSM 46488]|nr:Small membrane protein [Streptantibioticus cattleyicolor NRRL 8057 = DSM 46488]